MIEIMREIGEYAMSQRGFTRDERIFALTDDHIPILVEDPRLESNAECMVLLIELEDNLQNAVFTGLDIESFKVERIGNYLYRRSPSNAAPDTTPTTKLSKSNRTFKIETTFRRRVLGWFKSQQPLLDLFCRIDRCLKGNTQSILEKLSALELDKEKNYLISIRVNGLYLGEYQEFRQIFLRNVMSRYRKFDKRDVYSTDAVCSLCGWQGQVYGNAAPFAWYSLDKECYIAGGFDIKTAWRNFSICLNCALQLEAGKTYIFQHLNRTFAGVPFMLLPHFILAGTEQIEEPLSIYEGFDKRRLSIADDQRIVADENDILSRAEEFENYIVFSFLFYRKENARLRILLSVEDVYPSRFKQISDARKYVEAISVFSQNEVSFSFASLKRLVNPSTDSLKEFLDYTNRIFKEIPISHQRFMSQVAARFRQGFAEDRLYRDQVLSSFACFLFIHVLKLFHDRKEVSSMTQSALTIEGMERLESFFQQFTGAFDSLEKKGVFLLGVLTQNLLDIQFREKDGSTPFRKKLRGLKLRREDLIALLPAVQNKLEEYEKNYYRQLESIISAYLVQAQSKWKLNMDEISFYFTLGMNLNTARDSEGMLFKSGKQEEEVKNE